MGARRKKKRVHFFFFICLLLCKCRHTRTHQVVEKRWKAKELAALCQLFIILFVLIFKWLDARMYVKVILFFVEFANSHMKSRTNVGVYTIHSCSQLFNFKRTTIQFKHTHIHTCASLGYPSTRKMINFSPFFPLRFNHRHLIRRKHHFHHHFYCSE